MLLGATLSTKIFHEYGPWTQTQPLNITVTLLINHSQSVRYSHIILYLILIVSFAHITLCVLVSYFFIYFLRLLLHVNHVQPICTFISCTVMLILIFKSTVYYHAHYFIFCSYIYIYIYIYIFFFFFFFSHFILCILCVVFYHGTTLAGYHQTPNASTTEATWARDSLQEAVAPDDDNTASLGWRLGTVGEMCRCREHPWAPGHAQNTHRAHHQAPLSARGHRVVVVPGCHGSLQTESQPAGSHSTQKNYTLHPSFSINQNGTAHAKSTYPTYALSQNLLYCQFCHMYSTYIERTFRIEITLLSSQVTFIYIALLTIQIVSKHLTVSSWRIECQ